MVGKFLGAVAVLVFGGLVSTFADDMFESPASFFLLDEVVLLDLAGHDEVHAEVDDGVDYLGDGEAGLLEVAGRGGEGVE